MDSMKFYHMVLYDWRNAGIDLVVVSLTIKEVAVKKGKKEAYFPNLHIMAWVKLNVSLCNYTQGTIP